MSNQWRAFWRHYQAGNWEPETKALIDATLEPGDLFVDVGAWIGPLTLWALERDANVVAVEPDPVACAELRKVAPAAEIHECALTPEGGATRLRARRGSLGNSMTQVSEDGDVMVTARTLNAVLMGRRPALVSVDVEGYEVELLPAIVPYLAALKVPLHVELHGHLVDTSAIKRDLFSGYSSVEWPTEPKGHLVALP